MKKPYERPEMKKVELKPEEVLLKCGKTSSPCNDRPGNPNGLS